MTRTRLDPRDSRLPLRENLVERRIREAMEAGVFDELPFQGERLQIEDDAAAGTWGPAYRMLRNAGMAPPWIEADKEVRLLLERIERAIAVEARSAMPGRSRRRHELARLIAGANAAIARLNAEAPSDRLHRRLLDQGEVLARFEDAAGIADATCTGGKYESP